MRSSSHMLRETAEAAGVVERLLSDEAAAIRTLAARLRSLPPPVITTAGRGSSDHAATYFKYLFEIVAGIPVASIGPSVASVYRAELQLRGAAHFTVSQSGASPDIVALQAAAGRGGALTVAFVNVTDSPLAREADVVIPLHAGEEQSIAATKSFVAACTALAAFAAAYAGDAPMEGALRSLPAALSSPSADGIEARDLLAGAASIYTAGRGPAFAIALEAALKAKETAAIHAEAFSLAEVMHGPARLAGDALPVIAFLPDDAALANGREGATRLARLGSPVIRISSEPDADIRVVPAGSGLIDPIVMIAAYYRLIERVAWERGHDPDAPLNLAKVTRTV